MRTARALDRMNQGPRWRLALVVLLVLPFLYACDDGLIELALVFGGSLEVSEGTTREGAVVVLDGSLLLHSGSSVRGPVVVLGGIATLEGTVEGDVIALAGALRLGPLAHVKGDLAAAGELERDPLARVDGVVTLGPAVPETLSGALRDGPSSWPNILVRAASLALLGTLASRFAARGVDRLSEAVRRHTLTAGALGVLAVVVGLALLVVMAFTVVLIPISLMGLVLGFVAVLVGWSAVGIALGTGLAQRWLSPRPGRRWQRFLAVAAGVFAVVTVLGALERVPVAGALIALLVTAVGLGAGLLTGFGARRFVPDPWPSEDPVPSEGPFPSEGP